MVAVPSLLEEIIEDAVRASDDVRVTTKTADRRAWAADFERTVPDVVLLGLGEGDRLSDFEEVLYRSPRTRLIGVSIEGRNVQALELAPQATHIGNVSPEELLEVIRKTGHRTPGGEASDPGEVH